MLKVAHQDGEFVMISSLASFGLVALLRKKKRKLQSLVQLSKTKGKGNKKLCIKSKRKRPNFSSMKNEIPKQEIKQVSSYYLFSLILKWKWHFQDNQKTLLPITFLGTERNHKKGKGADARKNRSPAEGEQGTTIGGMGAKTRKSLGAAGEGQETKQGGLGVEARKSLNVPEEGQETTMVDRVVEARKSLFLAEAGREPTSALVSLYQVCFFFSLNYSFVI